MSIFRSQLVSHLNQYSKLPIVIACSGGVDSMVLLHEVAYLVETKPLSQLTVCYVNHGLSENADYWQEFVQKQCQQLALEFVAKKVDLSAADKQSLEAKARAARYQALKEVAGDNGVVLTGHHLDDQSETLLLALKRGAGLKGLSAMTSVSEMATTGGALTLCRPFLAVSRAEMVNRAEQLGLQWIEDESNQDCQFDRNFIRQQLMPLLKARWPAICTTIARSAEHCQDAEQLISEIAEQDLANCQLHSNVLAIDKLLALSSSRFNYLMRCFLAKHQQLMPSSAQLAQVRQQLSAEQDKLPAVKVGDIWLRRFKSGLYLTPEFADLSDWQQKVAINALTDREFSINLPDGLGQLQLMVNGLQIDNGSDDCNSDVKVMAFSLPEGVSELRVCFSPQNLKCHPDYRQHSRELKKIWQELAVPSWQRKRVPLVFAGEQLVMAVGYFVCREFLVDRHIVKCRVCLNL